MKEITLATGLETYVINGVCQLTFNPTDSVFLEKLLDVFDRLDSKQETYRVEVEKWQGDRKLFEQARIMDGEMREIINAALGTDVCGPLFGEMNVYAFADGLPLWANLMFGLLDEIDAAVVRERKAYDPRIAKYTKKYHK